MNPLAIIWDVNPVAFSLGSLDIAWYGILWATALGAAWWIFDRMVRREGLDSRMIESATWYIILGTIIGARLGHCLFYEPDYYFLDPFMKEFPYIKLLDIRGGGLASHGAALGILTGIWLFCRKWKVPTIWLLDRIAVIVPLSGAIVRIGNLINSEVYGVPTDLPWGFVFKQMGETVPMHPTQLYEALAYLVIFALMAHLYWRTQLPNRRGLLFGLFLILLFTARLLIETIKLPQEEFEQGLALNMGQILSIPFILAGIVILVMALRRPARPYTGMPVEQGPSRSERRRKNNPI